MIYKQPSIYKQGEENSFYKWENITNKLGHNSSAPSSCSYNIYLNRDLGMLNLRSYGGYSVLSTADRDVFIFNYDIDFSIAFDAISRSSNGSTTLLTTDTTLLKAFIYCSGVSYIDWAIQSTFITITEETLNKLINYIDSH